jgi:lipopolysaccharide transport system ATP-binding protein
VKGPSPIVIEGVSKRYELGTTFQSSLSERAEHLVRAPIERVLGRREKGEKEDRSFWALRDVSFEVEPGTIMGLVGANGAGKSTLLKLLARITFPTEGQITMRGRVGSLLEVGTGFHPELTGRENVFLNGTILGIPRKEIQRRFDEIVDFSGIERFIDTPVKRYSSGMYLRLAFAVASHLETDTLLLDEVLAVGDAEFQRRSLRKIDAASGLGRTVVFVSHDISNVQRLCDRCAWIDGGRLAMIGPTHQVVSAYLNTVTATPTRKESVIADDVPRGGEGVRAKVVKVAMLNERGEVLENVRLAEPFSVRLTIEVDEQVDELVTEIGINAVDGSRALTSQNMDGGRPRFSLSPGTHEVVAALDPKLLPGDYTIDVALHRLRPDPTTYDNVQRVLAFTVDNEAYHPHDRYPWETVRGAARADSEWTIGPRVEPIEAPPSSAPVPTPR